MSDVGESTPLRGHCQCCEERRGEGSYRPSEKVRLSAGIVSL